MFLIVGDFNFPGYKWFYKQTYSSVIGSHDDHIVNECIDLVNEFCSVYKFFQHDHFINVKGNTLDLVFSNVNNLLITEANDVFIRCDNYHTAVDIQIPIQSFMNRKAVAIPFYDFKNVAMMAQLMMNCIVDNSLMDYNDINSMIDNCTADLSNLINNCHKII